MDCSLLRTAAEPGGHLPYRPTDYGYEWFHGEDPGTYVATSRDGLTDLILRPADHGAVEWSAVDDHGVVEKGNFSGIYDDPSALDGLLYRGDRLLAEFDTNPSLPPKSFGYDKDYTEDFPTSFPAPDFREPGIYAAATPVAGWLSTSAALHYFDSVITSDDLDPDFVADIAQNGILDPVEINCDGNYARITEGHHRVLAAEELGLPEVPVLVYRVMPGIGNYPNEAESELRALLAGTYSRLIAAETIPYQRNNNGMRGVPGFGQELEPWGRYMSEDAPRELPEGWERGQVTFANPLRIEHDSGGWKAALSIAHGGLTGKALSQALLAAGYDGVITHDQYGIGEIVDIRPSGERGHVVSSAAQKCEYCDEQATQRIIHSEGMAFIPTCDNHLQQGKDDAAACVPYGEPDPSNIDRVEKVGALAPGPESNSSGVAVVLGLLDEDRDALAIEGGEPSDDLHVTLGYFGDARNFINGPNAMLDICAEIAATTLPFVVNLNGITRFCGEETDPLVVNADSPVIDGLHHRLIETMQAAGFSTASGHGFTPHMTLGYLQPDDDLPMDRWEPVEVNASTLELWFGGERFAYEFARAESDELVAAHLAFETRVATYAYEPFEMPTEAVWHYRKFDLGEEDPSQMQDDLVEDIARYGIQKPLSIALGSDHRQALLQDGNHRIDVARKLGLATVPVWIDEWDEQDTDYLRSIGAKDLEPWLRQWAETNLVTAAVVRDPEYWGVPEGTPITPGMKPHPVKEKVEREPKEPKSTPKLELLPTEPDSTPKPKLKFTKGMSAEEIEQEIAKFKKLPGKVADYLDYDAMQDSLIAKYNAATDDQKEWGHAWYETGQEYIENIADRTGFSPHQVAGVMAAFSPQTAWDPNVADATHFLMHYDPDNPMSHAEMPGLDENLERARHVMEAEDDPDAVLDALGPHETAPKIRNFYKNLMGDKNSVTLDSWMSKAMVGEGTELADPKLAQKVLSWSYDRMSDALRAAADKLGIDPRALQATVWTQVNNTAEYDPWTPDTFQKKQIQREKAWTKVPHQKPIPDYEHGPAWNSKSLETGEPLLPEPSYKGEPAYHHRRRQPTVLTDKAAALEAAERFVRNTDYWGLPEGTPIKPGMKPKGEKPKNTPVSSPASESAPVPSLSSRIAEPADEWSSLAYEVDNTWLGNGFDSIKDGVRDGGRRAIVNGYSGPPEDLDGWKLQRVLRDRSNPVGQDILGGELVARAVHSEPTTVALWRGAAHDPHFVASLREGLSIAMPLSSFSPDYGSIQRYVKPSLENWTSGDRPENGVPVVYHLEPGAKAARLSEDRDLNPAQEHVVFGEFEIVEVTPDTSYRGDGAVEITIRQTSLEPKSKWAYAAYMGVVDEDTSRLSAVNPMDEDIAADSGYFYHATSDWNLGDIEDSGVLSVHDPDYGTDQGAWPDASNEPRSYWTHDPAIARSFYPEDGDPVLLRAPRAADFRRESTGDYYLTSDLPASRLEQYVGDGRWAPLR